MTNATVAESVAGNDGHTLMIKYKDGEKKVVVSPDTPVVTYVPADKSDLKAGAKMIAFMKKVAGRFVRNQPRQRRPRRPDPADVNDRGSLLTSMTHIASSGITRPRGIPRFGIRLQSLRGTSCRKFLR